MSVKVEKLEHSMAKLTIELPAEELEEALDKSYKKNKGRFNVPGFRKGKVPRAIVEKMFGAEILYEDAANELIGDSYPDAMKESGEDIVSRPEVDVVQIEKGKPFIYTAEVALKPPVELAKYEGVKVTEHKAEPVTDEDVKKAIDAEREKNARIASDPERVIEKGDTAVIDFAGTIDGEAFDGGTGENHPLEIGSGTFIPGFEDQLIGKKTGDHVDVAVRFPEDYHAAELAGKDAVFATDIKEVKVKELPEADDEFAQDVSEFDTLEEYEKDIREKIERTREDQAKSIMSDAAIAQVAKESKIDIPPAMLKYQSELMLNQAAQSLSQQGISIEQYMKIMNTTYDDMLKQFEPEAEQHIRRELVLEAIAKEKNFEATDDDLSAEIERTSKMYGLEPDQFREYLSDDDTEAIRNDIKLGKARKLIGDTLVPTKEKKKPAKKDEKKDVPDDSGKSETKSAAKKKTKKTAEKADSDKEESENK